MNSIALQLAKTIATANNQFLPLIPTFANVKGVDDFVSDHVFGTNLIAKTGSQLGGINTSYRFSGEYEYLCFTHAEMFTLFSFWQERMANIKSFWMPSWVSDFQLASHIEPASRDFITVKENLFEWIFAPNRYGILIVTENDVCYLYKIQSYDRHLNRIYIGTSLDVDIPMQSVKLFSLVRRVRFSSQQFKRVAKTDYVVNVALDVIECPNEGQFV